MLEDIISIDLKEANAALKKICADLVRESKPSVLLEIMRAGERAKFVPNIDTLPEGIQFDSKTEGGWKFTDTTAQTAKWLNFNVPKIEFFRTLTERWMGHLLSQTEPAFQKMLKQ